MKKLLLVSVICAFLFQLAVSAYETIIIDFPKGTKWNVAYYKNIGVEAILQYTPEGQSYTNWKQTLIVHSYKESTYPAHQLSSIIMGQLQAQNPTGHYKYLKYTGVDSIVVRSSNTYNKVLGQGEFFRTTKSAEGLMTIHYIDRDKVRFKQDYEKWLKIVRDARTYNSYWRDDRVLNKGEHFEL